MLYSTNGPNFAAWLSSLLEIIDNVYIAIVSQPGCDINNFEVNLIFLIKPFFCMTKKSRQKSKYLQKEKSFKGEIKTTFHYF